MKYKSYEYTWENVIKNCLGASIYNSFTPYQQMHLKALYKKYYTAKMAWIMLDNSSEFERIGEKNEN